MRNEALSAVGTGLAAARRRPGVVLATYLGAALPAALWLGWVAPALDAALARRPLAQGLLGPDAVAVWIELVLSPSYSLSPAFAALPVFALFAWGLQLLVAGGTVTVLLGKTVLLREPVFLGETAPLEQTERSLDAVAETGNGTDPEAENRPASVFWLGARRCFGRFVRAALVFVLALVPVILVAAGGFAVAGAAARATGDERWRLGLGLVVIAVAYALFALVDLAYDLVRIAAVEHGRGSMFRGMLRALRWVLRRPGRMLLLHLSFVVCLLVAQGLYLVLRIPLTPAGTGGVVLMILLQQALMLGRAWLQVSFWAAEVEIYRRGGAPPLAGR